MSAMRAPICRFFWVASAFFGIAWFGSGFLNNGSGGPPWLAWGLFTGCGLCAAIGAAFMGEES